MAACGLEEYVVVWWVCVSGVDIGIMCGVACAVGVGV